VIRKLQWSLAVDPSLHLLNKTVEIKTKRDQYWKERRKWRRKGLEVKMQVTYRFQTRKKQRRK